MKKRVLITGASSDIGIETVKKFLDNNCFVTAHCNKNTKNLKQIKNKHNKNLQVYNFDFKKIKKFEKFVKNNEKFFRNFDIFISLSGYNEPDDFQNLNLKKIIDHLNVNYFSAYLISKEVILHMAKRNWGRILFTSSIGTKYGGGEKTFAYSLSKYLNEFFPSYFKKFTKSNVLYNCLRIGVTDTKIHKLVKNKNIEKRISLIPMKRMAKPKEIAEYIYFICSNKNTQISKQILTISGGE